MSRCVDTQFCSDSLVPGYYIDSHKREVCNSVERASLELNGGSSPGEMQLLLPLSSAAVETTVTTDRMDAFPGRENKAAFLSV